ncbi:MAG TPA: hypothetical protein VG412_06735 [Acidimicrobiales bacterium]|nr:hypothetical protein [Acidimicrobiales bacterium]
MSRRSPKLVAARLGMAAGLLVAMIAGPAAAASAAPAETLVGYTALTQAVGAQFAFNVPGVVPLPNQNLIEEDVPFARVNVAGGPVVDSLSAPFYPGDIAANLGSLLATFGFPGVLPNDPFLAEAKFPTSPGFPAKASFGGTPAPGSAPLAPSIFSAVSHAAAGGGDATSSVLDLSIDSLGNKLSLPIIGGIIPSASNLLDVGNISTSDAVSVDSSQVKASSTSMVKALDIAGLVDISGLTSNAACASDGTTAAPTASLTLGQVTVDGAKAFIDSQGVHIGTASTGTLGVTPATVQKTLDATLAADGISIRVLDPVLTTNGAAGTANAGGLVVSLAHQFDVPFIPGEPTIPVPELGNVGLPAGLYTMTTSITFGMAQVDVSAAGIPATTATSPTGTESGVGGLPVEPFDTGSGITTFPGTPGTVQSLATTGPGSAAANRPIPTPTSATAFPIRGIPAPLGWLITALLACVLLAYPLLLLARWQFLAGRRR